jgi:hypothetical protein
VPHNESQMIHPTQQLSGSALRTFILVSSPQEACCAKRTEPLRWAFQARNADPIRE